MESNFYDFLILDEELKPSKVYVNELIAPKQGGKMKMAGLIPPPPPFPPRVCINTAHGTTL